MRAARQGAITFGCANSPWRLATVSRDSLPWRWWVLACRPAFWVTPDWPGLLRRLDSLDVWSLPDRTAQMGDQIPGTGAVVVLDMFDRRGLRRLRHGDRASQTTPDGRRAFAIQAAVSEAIAAAQYAPNAVLPFRARQPGLRTPSERSRCAGPDEFSRAIMRRYTALATSTYPSHVANREALGISMHELTHHHYADGSVFPAEECPILSSVTDAVQQRVGGDIFWTKSGEPLPVSARLPIPVPCLSRTLSTAV